MFGGFFIRESKTPGMVKFSNNPSTDNDTDFAGVSVALSLKKIKDMIRMLGGKPPSGMKKAELQSYLIKLSTGQAQAPTGNMSVAQIKDKIRALGLTVPKLKKPELLAFLKQNSAVSLPTDVFPSGVVDKKIKIKKKSVSLPSDVFPSLDVVDKKIKIQKKSVSLPTDVFPSEVVDKKIKIQKPKTEEGEFKYIVSNWESDTIAIYIYKSTFFKELYDNIEKDIKRGKMVIAGNLFNSKRLERLLDFLYERYGIEKIDDVIFDMVEQLDGKMKRKVYIRYVPKLNRVNGEKLFNEIAPSER